MFKLRHVAASAVLLSSMVLWSCVDEGLVGPDPDASLTQFASTLDGTAVYEAPGFYFFSPLADQSPAINEEFNPSFLPELRVCRLAGDPGTACVANSYTTLFEPGEADVNANSEQYSWSWDTGSGRSPEFEAGKGKQNQVYYQLQVAIGDRVLGSVDLDPQNPNGPGQTAFPDDTYAFRVGEKIPVKTFIGVSLFCDTSDAAVLECITNQVVGPEGGFFALDGSGIGTAAAAAIEGAGPTLLSVFLAPNASPVEFLLTLERLDRTALPDDCIDGFDAPLVSDDCFRITSSLENSLDRPALVSICLDIVGADLEPGDPLRALQMVKVAEDESGNPSYSTVASFPAACSSDDVPADDAIPVGTVGGDATLVSTTMDFGLDDDDDDDGPSDDVPITLGGLSSSFSKYAFAYTGQLLENPSEDGFPVDGSVIPFDDNDAPTTISIPILVADRIARPDSDIVDTIPVAGATLRVTAVSEGGSTSVGTADIVTDENGEATFDWSIDDSILGEATLTLSSLGVATQDDPDPSVSEPITEESRTFTVTVLGPPADATAAPTTLGAATVGEEAGDITVTVVDEAGQAIPGATVEWTGDGLVEVCVTDGETETCETVTSTTTGADGTTTVTWSYGTTAGDQTLTFSVPNTEVGGSVTGSATAGAAVSIVVSPTASFGVENAATIPVSVDLVADGFGNPVAGAALTWSASVSGDALTAADGSASGIWTLGDGDFFEASVSVDGTDLVGTFRATTGCSDGYGTATADGVPDERAWECAITSGTFDLNLGGGSTPAVLKTMNDDENVYFLLRVEQGTGSDIFSLRFDFDNTGNGTSGDDDIVGYDADTRELFDGYLSAGCVNKSQSRCFLRDGAGMEQVAAGATKDGTYTYYEIAHPLNSGDEIGGLPIDLDATRLRVEDDEDSGYKAVPFFITLSNGNGAKGNSQYPGFRDYGLSFTAVKAPTLDPPTS